MKLFDQQSDSPYHHQLPMTYSSPYSLRHGPFDTTPVFPNPISRARGFPAHHPDVLKLARVLHRPPASLSMKIGNIGRFDPTLSAQGIVGLAHGAKSKKQIWDEFAGRYDLLAEECYRIRQGLGTSADMTWDDESIKTPAGLDGVRLSHYRINQHFFRSSVLSAYEDICCVTGISDRLLLIASHIKPWTKCENGNERTDSQNGLCLSPLYDKFFDKGLMTIDDDYTVVANHESRITSHESRITFFVVGREEEWESEGMRKRRGILK